MLKVYLKHLPEEVLVKLHKNITKKYIITYFWSNTWYSNIPGFLIFDVKQWDYMSSLQTVVI